MCSKNRSTNHNYDTYKIMFNLSGLGLICHITIEPYYIRGLYPLQFSFVLQFMFKPLNYKSTIFSKA